MYHINVSQPYIGDRDHTHFPAIQVERTSRSSLSNTKSASLPILSVPFEFSIPKAWAGCNEAASSASILEHSAIKKINFGKKIYYNKGKKFLYK